MRPFPLMLQTRSMSISVFGSSLGGAYTRDWKQTKVAMYRGGVWYAVLSFRGSTTRRSSVLFDLAPNSDRQCTTGTRRVGGGFENPKRYSALTTSPCRK
ncbi:hypothetical protein IW262DRAFT_319551 [Armillaria fumosa]|nr:hypothetical protein IW262DRAFT_319551 [Armillaria fumosa]